jgi:hypothetical protein
MKLNDKQSAKVADILASVSLTDVSWAIVNAKTTPTVAAIKGARQTITVEKRKLDKALVIYGLDLALDEAKALIAKAEKKA